MNSPRKPQPVCCCWVTFWTHPDGRKMAVHLPINQRISFSIGRECPVAGGKAPGAAEWKIKLRKMAVIGTARRYCSAALFPFIEIIAPAATDIRHQMPMPHGRRYIEADAQAVIGLKRVFTIQLAANGTIIFRAFGIPAVNSERKAAHSYTHNCPSPSRTRLSVLTVAFCSW